MAGRGGIFRPRWRQPPPVQQGLETLTAVAAVSLTATGIATSAPTVGAPAIGQVHALTATGIATGAPTVGTPAIGQVHVLAATGITASPTVGTPAIGQTHVLTATGITATPSVGSPAIGQTHVLTATGITATPAIGTPAIRQIHVLSATGIATGAPTVGAPVLTDVPAGTDALTANGITTTPTVGTPTLAQIHALIANGITVSPIIGLPTLNAPTLTGVDYGFGASVQKVGDTRWHGVRDAREVAAQAFREVEKAKPKDRKQAAAKASEAIAAVAQKLGPNIRASEPAPAVDSFTDVLQDLDALQAYLASLMDAERIKAQEARQAAEQWALIERELHQQAIAEEELMLVLALAW